MKHSHPSCRLALVQINRKDHSTFLSPDAGNCQGLGRRVSALLSVLVSQMAWSGAGFVLHNLPDPLV